MSILLAEAVAQLGLQPGQTYRTTIDGREIEVSVRESAEKPPPAAEDEEPSEYEDWEMRTIILDIPPSPNAIVVRAVPGKLSLPDPPVIPPDDETEE